MLRAYFHVPQSATRCARKVEHCYITQVSAARNPGISRRPASTFHKGLSRMEARRLQKRFTRRVSSTIFSSDRNVLPVLYYLHGGATGYEWPAQKYRGSTCDILKRLK